jgi:hypothetical protein
MNELLKALSTSPQSEKVSFSSALMCIARDKSCDYMRRIYAIGYIRVSHKSLKISDDERLIDDLIDVVCVEHTESKGDGNDWLTDMERRSWYCNSSRRVVADALQTLLEMKSEKGKRIATTLAAKYRDFADQIDNWLSKSLSE